MPPELTRAVRDLPATCEPVVGKTPANAPLDNVGAWLAEQGATHKLGWLLAHADDGVIWGRIDGQRLITSHDAARGHAGAEPVCRPLRSATLRQARLFGPAGELLLWRDGENGWHARVIQDGAAGESATWERAFDEEHLLWGTRATPIEDRFTLIEHAAEGLRHALPMPVTFPIGRAANQAEQPRLLIRHYLDRHGPARVVASRLVDLLPREAAQ